MSFVKIYIHIVWSTKNREAFLNTPEILKKVWFHIKEYGTNNNIFIDYINGYQDHCHCLVSLNVNQSVQEVIKLLKGESSFWINNNSLIDRKFEWQKEYFACSVSESLIIPTREYIKKQELHHETNSYEDELTSFKKIHGFVK